MKNTVKALLLIFFAFCLFNCNAQENAATERYTYKKSDPNGIGKWYLGREIAHVMGYQGINWLNRPEREKEENTSILLKNMGINNDDLIADVGAGSGYHVFKMASIAKNGIIYAVDIQDEMLNELRKNKKISNISNVEIVKGSRESVNLPANSVDKVLMVDVYHEFDFPVEMIESVKMALKPKGKLFLIEYRGEDASVPIKKVHKMTEAQAVREMDAVGLKLERNISNLPWQHCMVFIKK